MQKIMMVLDALIIFLFCFKYAVSAIVVGLTYLFVIFDIKMERVVVLKTIFTYSRYLIGVCIQLYILKCSDI